MEKRAQIISEGELLFPSTSILRDVFMKHNCILNDKNDIKRFLKNSRENVGASKSSFKIISTHFYDHNYGLRTPNEAFFLSKSQTFGLGETNWAEIFWDILGTYFQPIYLHPFWYC